MAESSSTHLHPNRTVSDNQASRTTADHGIQINEPSAPERRPSPAHAASAPNLQSPMRHHRRAPSRSKDVKETLNARSHYGSSDEDGPSVHRINQYVIKQEIGRGSFGSVHLAVDQFGNEFAVKEFSKSRLRKRAQSNLLRNPNGMRRPGQIAAGMGFNSPMHRSGSADAPADNTSLSLIKEEIAIMKKLSHNNLVSLIEVLDDPQEDSLYMVLEMCKKGVAMKVGLDERADPYDDETCRCWFRDMILGIEYLHAQGIIHRDIKPDNCLITSDDVLKIVDFGVSEMFEKASEMATAKSAGSPAFMPPELCVAKHGQVSGKAADIWSMGVTLYCLRYGRIPFEKGSLFELYDSIRGDDLELNGENDGNFSDLMRRILEKDPDKRITMGELREHPWVTKNGTDNLLSAEENCSDLVEPPTEDEMAHAITGNMAYLVAVMKAVKRFKKAVREKRGLNRLKEGIFGRDSKIVTPPQVMDDSQSDSSTDRKAAEEALIAEGLPAKLAASDDWNRLSRDVEQLNVHESPSEIGDMKPGMSEMLNAASITEAIRRPPYGKSSHSMDESEDSSLQDSASIKRRSRTFPLEEHQYGKGQARDPLEEHIYINIGANPDDEQSEYPMVSESPSAVDMNIFEQAYQDEMNRILENKGESASMYMTRRVEHRDDIRRRDQIKDAGKWAYKRAGEKYDELYSKALPKWESANRMYQEEGGRFAARHAANKVYAHLLAQGASAREAIEAGREAAKLVAQEDAANDLTASRTSRFSRFSSKTGEMGDSISGMAKKAQDRMRKSQSSETRLRAGDRLAKGTLRMAKPEREGSVGSGSPQPDSASSSPNPSLSGPSSTSLSGPPASKPTETPH